LGSTSTSGTVAIWDSVMVRLPCPALYTNFQGGHCLTHVGTEGRSGPVVDFDRVWLFSAT
jgi:hypothetical protein